MGVLWNSFWMMNMQKRWALRRWISPLQGGFVSCTFMEASCFVAPVPRTHSSRTAAAILNAALMNKPALAFDWQTSPLGALRGGFWLNSNTQGHIFSLFEYSTGCSFWSWLWNTVWFFFPLSFNFFFFFNPWKRSVNVNPKWSFRWAVYWVELRRRR